MYVCVCGCLLKKKNICIYPSSLSVYLYLSLPTVCLFTLISYHVLFLTFLSWSFILFLRPGILSYASPVDAQSRVRREVYLFILT